MRNQRKLKVHHAQTNKLFDKIKQLTPQVNTLQKVKDEKKDIKTNKLKMNHVLTSGKNISFGTVFYLLDTYKLSESKNVIKYDGDNDLKVKYQYVFNKLKEFKYVKAVDFLKKGNEFYELIKDFDGFDQWMADLERIIYDDQPCLIVMSNLEMHDIKKQATNYKTQKVNDDTNSAFISNDFIQYKNLGENYIKSLYSSKYIQQNHLKGSCLPSLFIDVYKGPIEKEWKKFKLTYESYNSICRPDEPLKKVNNAYCMDEHQRICEKFKLAFYVFDLNQTIMFITLIIT